MNPKEVTVLLFLRRIGPYHHARFQAASKTLRLASVETRALSVEYPWEFNETKEYESASFSVATNVENGLRGEVLIREVKEVFDKYQPGVVVTTGWADPEYHAVVAEASRRKIPAVVISDSRYEDEPRKFYKEWIKQLILKSYSAGLVAGTASREYMIRLGFDATSIFQPWDVVDNNYFKSTPNELAFDARYFLCISRFILKKNLLLLIDAYSHYRAQGGIRELILLGSGELETILRDRIAERNMENVIHMKGFVQYPDLPKFLHGALCLILPSVSDQWGLVVNEALASGLPVLVSEQCGCAQDLVKPGVNGYTFNPLSEAGLFACMKLIDEKSPAEWQAMSVASVSTISEWGLDNFSTGLQNACTHAVKRPSFGRFAFIHKLLSR